jgi:hypothetical protein
MLEHTHKIYDNIITSLTENRQAPGHGNMSGLFFAHTIEIQ